jgi:N5-(cytidine 5'-diphosphoramidyl)-L-glutamine hydrolase
MATKSLRLGITMREAAADGYYEPRDALARDWARYMTQALPDAAWLPIPNLGEDAVEFCERWRIDGLILSGGEDPGAAPARDATEQALLRSFIAAGRPILAVCRGLQMLWTHFGGELVSVEGHVATHHEVQLLSPEWQRRMGTNRLTVNSFHAKGLLGATPPELAVLATTDNESIEAIWRPQAQVVGVMWHPERESPVTAFDRALARWVFFGEGNS